MDSVALQSIIKSFEKRLGKISINLDAPVPSWVHYNTEQTRTFGDKHYAETVFANSYGENIEEKYLNNYENMLSKVYEYIEGGNPRNFCVAMCSVFACNIALETKAVHPFLKIFILQTRPCAESLGFARIFFWKVIQCCIKKNYGLAVLEPVEKTIGLLTHISHKFYSGSAQIDGDQYADCMKIDLSDMKTLTLDNFHIRGYLSDFDAGFPYMIHLNPRMFPYAAQLNDATFLEERKKTH